MVSTIDKGPIFLRRFKLYMFSFTFGFMFANIYFEERAFGLRLTRYFTNELPKWNFLSINLILFNWATEFEHHLCCLSDSVRD